MARLSPGGYAIQMMPGVYVIYAMVAVLPFALLWYALLTHWKRVRGSGKAPQIFSLCTGLGALALSMLLQFQMSPQLQIPGPDHDFYPQFWVLCLVLFTYGMPATWVGLFMFSSSPRGPARVPICSRCGNREHLHTEYCVRCGNRFLPRRPASDVPPA